MNIILTMHLPYLPVLGGANKCNRILAEALADKGHRIQVIVPATNAATDLSYSEWQQTLNTLGVEVESRDDVHRFELKGVEVHACKDPALVRTHLLEQIHTSKPDWVLVSGEEWSQGLLEASLSSQCRVIYLAHTVLFLPFGPLSFFPSPRRTSLLKHANHIVSVSCFVHDYIQKWSGLDSIVWHWPAYGAGPFPRLGSYDNPFVTLVNPSAGKGIAIFLELARRLHHQDFAAVPTWATTREDRMHLEALPNVHILEPCEDFDTILARTRVLLVPSLWPEGFSITVVEAMLRGIPTLTTNAGGLVDANLASDFILPGQQIESFSEDLDDRLIPTPTIPRQTDQDMQCWCRALEQLTSDRSFYEEQSAKVRRAALAFVSELSFDPFEDLLTDDSTKSPDPASDTGKASNPILEGQEQDDIAQKLSSLTPEQRAVLLQRLQRESPAALTENGQNSDLQSIPRPAQLPLSFAQQRLWFLDQFDPDSDLYNIPMAMRLRGPLLLGALSASVDTIVERHEGLRTSFPERAGEPYQLIASAGRNHLAVVVLESLPTGAAERETERLARTEATRIFDLAKGPLFHATLVRRNNQDHVLLINMHHIVSDGWSIGVFFRELGSLYDAFSNGQPSPLPELPVQYADFAIWQRNWLRGEVLQEQIAYWKDQLAGVPGLLELPTDRPRPAVQTYRGSSEALILSPELSQKIQALSHKEGATLFMTHLAAFQTLLWRYTGQADIAVGSPIAGRNREELEGLIGFFVNTLVLRSDLSGNPTFREFLTQVRETALGAYSHQDLPFEQLVEELEPQRSLSHSPLFQVMFALQNAPRETMRLPGITMETIPGRSNTAKFDLSLFLSETPSGIRGSLNYNSDLFDAPTIRRMIGHFEVLLAGIVADPDRRVSTLPLLTKTEERRLLVDWNDTARDYPKEQCIHELFEAQVERTPEAVAVVLPSTSPEQAPSTSSGQAPSTSSGQAASTGSGQAWEEQVTFRELNQRANQLAHHLRSLGVGPEVLVGVMMERSLEMVVGLLGILKAGGAYVPLDPTYPRERLIFMLEDSRTPVTLIQERLKETLPEYAGKVVYVDAEWQAITKQSEENIVSELRGESPAYMDYTSGSTGQPKGVLIPHRGVSRLLFGVDYVQLDESQTCLHLSSVSFDASTFEVWGPLLHGGRCVVYSERVPTPLDLSDALRRYEVNTLWLTASLFNLVIDEAPAALGGVEQLLIGGEALSVGHVRRGLEHLPAARIINGYGPTEGTTFTCSYEIPPELGEMVGSIPLGRPIANTRLYVLDTGLKPVPIGVTGELHLGGDGLARGYWERPEFTAEKFVPHPFAEAPGLRAYRTGDLARYLPDGNLEFLGRLDHQVKIRGFRIELGEIEAVLGQHPAVREVVVVTRPPAAGRRPEAEHRTPNTDPQRLVAYVVAGEALVASKLRAFLAKKLPNHMVPQFFMFLDELPLTPNGKLDRKALPEPEGMRTDLEQAYIAPRTETEELLTAIWGNVLGLDEIGVHDNFFELGGHSLLATQVISRVNGAFGVTVPLRDLFEAPTVAESAGRIAAALSGERLAKAPPLRPAARDEDLPLSFAQERLWFLDGLEPGTSTYNMPMALRLEGKLNVAALMKSLRQVVRRHETLRTVFPDRHGHPVLQILSEAHFNPAVVDLSALPITRTETENQRLARERALAPFDLATGPLFRVALLQSRDQEHVLLLNMHHIVSDGWSLSVLTRELRAVYDACTRGELSPLPDLSIQYADFALWQRNWLQGQVLDEQLSYWKQRLEGAPQLLELPTDFSRRAVQTHAGAQKSLVLSSELSNGLRTLSRAEGSTLFMILLGAFQLLCHRHTGQEHIVVGAPIAGRTRWEVEGLIGFFLNLLAIRTDVSGDPPFRELLRQVREVTLGAYAHQDIPFERLLDELKPERDLSRTSLFQVCLNVVNLPDSTFELPGLKAEPFAAADIGSKFDMTLYVREHEEGIRLHLSYAAELFSAERIQEILRQYEYLLSQIVADPDRRIHEYSLVTPASQELLPDPTARLNDTFQGAIHDLLAKNASLKPHQPAVCGPGESWTYAELDARSNQLANYLLTRGIEKGERIAVYAHRSATLVWAVFGVLKAGAAFVILDPAYPAQRLITTLRVTGARGWLQVEAAGPLPPKLQEFVETSPYRLRLTLPAKHANNDCLESMSQGPCNVQVGADDLACIGLTSGSAGEPKGVECRHGPLTHFVPWMAQEFELTESDRYCMLSGLSHDPLQRDIFTPTQCGATLCIPEPDHMGNSDQLLRWMQREEITVAHLTPAMVQFLGQASSIEANALRYAFVVGDVLTHHDIERLERVAPAVTCVNLYGTTETQRAVGFHVASSSPSGGKQIIPLGRGMPDVQLLVLNEHRQLAGIGELAQIHVRSPHLARGYVADAALSRDKFIPNPFTRKDTDRLYATGDLGRYLPDGTIEFCGRLDSQTKIRGFRIEPAEIEAVLSQHSKIGDSVVVTREHPTGQRLVACVVPRGEYPPDARELRAFLQDRLPAYMIPTAFVFLDELPLTPNEKVDRDALPQPGEAVEHAVAPRSTTQEVLTQIWSDVLHLERVGIHDNFFELGGHSLLATQVGSRLREAFAVEIPLRTLFLTPTVAELAEQIEDARNAQVGIEVPPITPVPREQELRLSFSQEREWLLDRLEPGTSAYNLRYTMRIGGPLEREALGESLTEIVKRHESLRTIFPSQNDRPVQVILPAPALLLPVVDLSTLPQPPREVEMQRLVQAEARTSFDLARGPLFRCLLIELSEEDRVLCATMHHIVTDGWSMGVFSRELWTLYEAWVRGEPSPLPKLALQYADYAQWQRRLLSGRTLENLVSYWRNQLRDAPPLLELPTDHPRPRVQTFGGARISFSRPGAIAEKIKAFCRQEGVTPFMTLLSGFKALLYSYTAQERINVGTFIANRNRAEIEPLIGFFVNNLVLSTDLSGNPSFRELLRRVRTVTLDAYAHQDLPFEKLLEELNPVRNPSCPPLFQVMFVMQNTPQTSAGPTGLTITPVGSSAQRANFDLTLWMWESGEGFRGSMEYNTNLFEEATVTELVEQYQNLMEELLQEPDRPLSETPVTQQLLSVHADPFLF